MKVEQVRLLKTLKAGKQVWVEGSYFPNDEYSSIPPEIILEVTLGKDTVEVTKYSEEEFVAPEGFESTTTQSNIKVLKRGRASLEEALVKEKAEVEAAKKPERKKSKLVRR